MYYETEIIIYRKDGGIESIDWDNDSTVYAFTVTEWINFSGFGIEDIDEDFAQLEISIRFWKDRTDKDDYIDPVLETSAIIGNDGVIYDEDAENSAKDDAARVAENAKKQNAAGGFIFSVMSRLRMRTSMDLLRAESGCCNSVIEFPGIAVLVFSAYDWTTNRNSWLWACYRNHGDRHETISYLSACDRPFSCSGEAIADYIARNNKQKEA